MSRMEEDVQMLHTYVQNLSDAHPGVLRMRRAHTGFKRDADAPRVGAAVEEGESWVEEATSPHLPAKPEHTYNVQPSEAAYMVFIPVLAAIIVFQFPGNDSLLPEQVPCPAGYIKFANGSEYRPFKSITGGLSKMSHRIIAAILAYVTYVALLYAVNRVLRDVDNVFTATGRSVRFVSAITNGRESIQLNLPFLDLSGPNGYAMKHLQAWRKIQ